MPKYGEEEAALDIAPVAAESAVRFDGAAPAFRHQSLFRGFQAGPNIDAPNSRLSLVPRDCLQRALPHRLAAVGQDPALRTRLPNPGSGEGRNGDARGGTGRARRGAHRRVRPCRGL